MNPKPPMPIWQGLFRIIIRLTLCGALIFGAYLTHRILALRDQPIKISISLIGVRTNETVTFTTKEGTFPVREAMFLITNLGRSKAVQEGYYRYESMRYAACGEAGINLGNQGLSSVLSAGQSRTITVVCPFLMHGPWRPVFVFSKYSWRHRIQELPPWKFEMLRPFVSEKWLMAIPSEPVAGSWVDSGPAGE